MLYLKSRIVVRSTIIVLRGKFVLQIRVSLKLIYKYYGLKLWQNTLVEIALKVLMNIKAMIFLIY